MLTLRYHHIVAILIAVLVPASAHAAVSLAFVDTDLTANGSTNVLPNGTFNVRLNLSSAAADQPVGIDYFLSMLGGGSGLFRIQDRNTTPPTTSPPHAGLVHR